MVYDLDSQFEKIIMGKEKHKFSMLGLSLLFSRLNTMYEKNPTPEQLNKCVEEVNGFVKKYEKIVARDLEKLAQ